MGLYPGTALWPAATGFYPEAGGELSPTVTTSGVTGITTTGATFAGSIDPNSLQAHYYWEYDGSQTPETVAGTAPVSVSRAVTGLDPGTYYNVRLVAFTAAGFGYGGWITFHTQAEPIRELLPDAIHFAGRGQ